MDDALNKARLQLTDFIGGPIRILRQFIEKTPSFCDGVSGSLSDREARAQRGLNLCRIHLSHPFPILCPTYSKSRAR